MNSDRPYVDQRVVDVDEATRAAAAAAESWELPTPRFLRQGMNVIYTCGDEVLRVGRTTAPAAASHELAVTLADRGLPVIEPITGHVLDRDGFAVTGWRRVDVAEAPVDWRTVGAAIARIHELDEADLPATYPIPSPTTFPWWDFDALLASVADRIDQPALAGLRRVIGEGAGWREAVDRNAVVCHGDVHPGNVLVTPSGPVLIDFDLLRRAAPAWDHAMLTTYTDRWGGAPDAYAAFAEGYGRSLADDELTQTIASLRNAAATLMRVRAGIADEAARAEVEQRLRYWRGDPEAPHWRAQ